MDNEKIPKTPRSKKAQKEQEEKQQAIVVNAQKFFQRPYVRNKKDFVKQVLDIPHIKEVAKNKKQ